MSNTTEAFMFELLRFFMRPYRMNWDMNGKSPYLESRRNVALDTVAHHHLSLIHLSSPTSQAAISCSVFFSPTHTPAPTLRKT